MFWTVYMFRIRIKIVNPDVLILFILRSVRFDLHSYYSVSHEGFCFSDRCFRKSGYG